MKRLRGGSGLGDSVYLRPIVDYLIRSGERVTVRSGFPDVFIGSRATVEPFSRANIDILAHYSTERQNQRSTQYADMLRCAKLPEIPLKFDWTVRNQPLVDRVRFAAGNRPVVIVHGGRAPFGRSDGLGIEILPQRAAFDAALQALEDCFTVRIGQGVRHYNLASSMDLYDQTRVSDLLDLVVSCDAVVTQCGYPIPMAECFGKPLLAIWSARGLASSNPVIASVTPAKILSAPVSHYVMDDWPKEDIKDFARAALMDEAFA